MSKELDALKSIKGTIISSRMGDWGFEYRYVSDIESTKKHFDIIEEALKRNELLKVDLTTARFDLTTARFERLYKCPNCGGHYIMKRSSYCPDCGQCLDWSDEE